MQDFSGRLRFVPPLHIHTDNIRRANILRRIHSLCSKFNSFFKRAITKLDSGCLAGYLHLDLGVFWHYGTPTAGSPHVRYFRRRLSDCNEWQLTCTLCSNCAAPWTSALGSHVTARQHRLVDHCYHHTILTRAIVAQRAAHQSRYVPFTRYYSEW